MGCEANWSTLDRLYLEGGDYKFLRIGNLPTRSASRPLVITNIHGQVRVGGQGHYYLFSISGGANWVLTGKYDPVSLTGDPAFVGHRAAAASATQAVQRCLRFLGCLEAFVDGECPRARSTKSARRRPTVGSRRRPRGATLWTSA